MQTKASAVLVVVAVIATLALVNGKSLPSYITPHLCKKSDPRLTECLLKLVEEMRPRLAKGMPEIKIPAMEPLHIPEVTVTLSPQKTGLDKTNNVKVVAKDIRCFGVSKFKVTKLKLDLEQHTYIVGVEVPFVSCSADYDVDARLLDLPIRGNGPITGNGTNVRGTAVMQGKLSRNKDGSHLKLRGAEISAGVEDINIHLENNYKGDTLLTEAFNVLVNSNTQLFIKAFTPVFEKTAAGILLELVNVVLDKVDYDEFLPARK